MKNEEYYEGVKIKGFKPQKEKIITEKKFGDINFKKSLGQNFLSDKNLLYKIAEYANVDKNDNVLEIGAGAGTLTEVLAEKAKRVTSYEIDKSLTERLVTIKNKNANLEVIFKDFMKVDLNDVFTNDKFKVVANIPYYITTPIIFKLMEISDRIETMIFMVQKEVALRFSAKENCKDYGVTSVILQSIADVKLLQVVKKECFTPAPKVDSALIEIRINIDKYNIKNYKNFTTFIHNAFAMRRKTLVNNLIKTYDFSKECIIETLKLLSFDENVRPEQISVENFVNLFNKLFN